MFCTLSFLPDYTRLPEAQLATSNEILRTIAISRLMLDNIPHIKAYRMNIGDFVAQMALVATQMILMEQWVMRKLCIQQEVQHH